MRFERGLHARLASIHRLMQQHPRDMYLIEQELTARTELAAIEDQRSSFTHHASVSAWIMKADRMSKDFFSAFKQRPAGSLVRGLIDASGTLQTDPDTVLSMATDYYETLFSAEIETDEISVARDMVWSHIHPSVSPGMATTLMVPFMERELQSAIAALDASSCLGDDGLTRQFFSDFWDDHHATLATHL